jgi:uncharacterized protein
VDKLIVHIADNPAQLAKGLMGVKKLDPNAGMLFKFPRVIEASFWGKNTYIPLDIAFIDSDDQITDIKEIVPMSTRSVRSSGNCSMAIEANRGFFKKNNILLGHKVIIVSKNDNTAEISFQE